MTASAPASSCCCESACRPACLVLLQWRAAIYTALQALLLTEHGAPCLVDHVQAHRTRPAGHTQHRTEQAFTQPTHKLPNCSCQTASTQRRLLHVSQAANLHAADQGYMDCLLKCCLLCTVRKQLLPAALPLRSSPLIDLCITVQQTGQGIISHRGPTCTASLLCWRDSSITAVTAQPPWL
jgi:hypothetical protein